MEQYKQEFIEFMVDCNVLKFGEFTLKSGRKSPFFMNAGAYVTGSQLKRLGEYYAQAIHDKYGDDGYIQLWIPWSDNALRLLELRTLLADHETARTEVARIYRETAICQDPDK